MSSETKICNKCQRAKPLTEFWVKSENKDGRNGKCKACHAAEYHGINTCQYCSFLDTCRVRVMQTDEEHRDWMPPCFVSSKYHELYKREYSSRRVAV